MGRCCNSSPDFAQTTECRTGSEIYVAGGEGKVGDPVNRITATFIRVDTAITKWMADNGVWLLRISLGLVFLWFGTLKLFPGLSPAQDLAAKTISSLTFGVISTKIALFVLALWESLIGLGLILGLFLRATLLLLWLQMLGTITPLFLFPDLTFTRIPFAPTLEGQYIIKNMVLISAGLVIGATVRGGRMTSSSINLAQKHNADRLKESA